MYCKNCGKELMAGANVCSNCGAQRREGKLFCENCGAKSNSTEEYCSKCGHVKQNYKASAATFAPTVKSIDKEFVIKNINTIFAVLSVILLLFPLFQLNAYELGYTNALQINGFEATTGMEFPLTKQLLMNQFKMLIKFLKTLHDKG